MKRQNILILTECACMLALATILSFVKIFQLSFGGTVTLCSMVPIIYLSFNRPLKWVLTTSIAYGLIQMLASFYAPPTKTFMSFLAVILLDYIIAFGILGLAGSIGKFFKGTAGIIKGTTAAIVGRFLCHFISGIVVWGVYAPEEQSVFVYSLLYNGSYMLAELLISLIALFAISKTVKRRDNG